MAVVQRAGVRGGGRRAPWAALVLLAVLVAGCGGGSDDSGAQADAEPTTAAPTDDGTSAGEAPGSSLTTTTATTAPGTTEPEATTLPEGAVTVPIDEDLVDRLPQIEGGGREVGTDEAFDERFCDGSKAPTVPKSQARATYPVSSTEELTVAAYRFSTGGGASYLADYTAAVRSCAGEAGSSVGLGVPELMGSAFSLTTEEGEAFIAMALDDDVLWILFQQSTDGPAEVDRTTLDVFLQTALG